MYSSSTFYQADKVPDTNFLKLYSEHLKDSIERVAAEVPEERAKEYREFMNTAMKPMTGIPDPVIPVEKHVGVNTFDSAAAKLLSKM